MGAISMRLEKEIAVLGAGACGQAFAADLSLAGCKVRLYELPEFAPSSLGEAIETHQIELGGAQINFKWFRRSGVAKLKTVTTNISEATTGAGLIIVAIPALGHKTFFEKLIPCLEDGQVISIFPDNFGSLVLREMMRQRNCDAKVIIGGWTSMPYGVRKMEPGKLDCICRIYRLMYDALPSRDGDRFYRELKDLPAFDGLSLVERGDTMVSIGFSNPNPIVHVPGSILNVGAMEVAGMEHQILGIPKGGYSMYKHGMSPAISTVQFAYYQELRKIAAVMGIRIIEHTEEQFFSKLSVMGVEYKAPFSEAIIPPIPGPRSTQDRYFIEDIGIGTVAYYNFAKKFGVEVPVIESLISLGSIICKKDFLKEGRSLKDMGIEHLAKEQMIKYLKEGTRVD